MSESSLEKKAALENQLTPRKDYFVLSTVYDAESNGAGIKLLDVDNNRVIYVTDPYGHEPYCFSRDPIEKIQAIEFPIGTKKRIESVTKTDLLNDDDINLTRIVTPTPSEVPKVRDLLGDTWESRIKYHRNWIYDVQIIPGRKYWWDPENKQFIPSQSKSSGMNIPQNVVEHLSQYKGL
ncbi:MAG: hypothetical protein ACFE95_19435, partial [Candidatus Hodarchaeota archaeon]